MQMTSQEHLRKESEYYLLVDRLGWQGWDLKLQRFFRRFVFHMKKEVGKRNRKDHGFS